jgi:ADP-heptose:LPS heptosyltransferase
MIPELSKISKQVIIDAHPRLANIFKNSFAELGNVVVYGTRKDNIIEWPNDHPEMTHKIAIGDLGKFFRRNLDDFPVHTGYLKADPELVDKYRKKLAKLGEKPKIGISWTGGYKKTRSDYRSLPLDKWKDLLSMDADFISLQYTPDAYYTVAEMEDLHDIKVHHWPSAVESFEYGETAALVEALDLVITVNTAVHHMAGALGKTCWTLTPKAKAWRYYSPDEDNATIPWYPSCRQFQQDELYKWDSVLERVKEELVEMTQGATV